MSERVVIRKAGKEHRCWTFVHGFDREWAEPRCDRMVAKGEPHVVSTIYPGDDSGAADLYERDANGVLVYKPRPVTEHFCMPCGERWTNLRDGLARAASQAAKVAV